MIHTITKKTRAQQLLITNFNSLSSDEIIRTLAEIRKQLMQIFRGHIGRANAITPYELFYRIYDIEPEKLDVYKRQYLFNIIKMVIRSMRRSNDLFVIARPFTYFVLQSKDELKSFQENTDRHISYLNQIKANARTWVAKKKWANL